VRSMSLDQVVRRGSAARSTPDDCPSLGAGVAVEAPVKGTSREFTATEGG
jgi:hypothetical protein